MLYDTSAYTALNDPDSWKPIVCWQSFVEDTAITATTEAAGYPASVLANYTTVERWQATGVLDGYLTNLFTATQVIDYIGLVRHNFGSGLVQTTIQTLNVGGNPATPGDWTTQKAAFTPPDDDTILLRMPSTSCDGVRIFYEPIDTVPFASVFRAGARLVLPQGIPPGGFTPITMGLRTEKATARTSGRDIIGKITTSSSLTSSFTQRDLDPTWYRANLDPLRATADEATIIFSWSPLLHPDEIAYCDIINDPIPTIGQRTGTVDITFELQGIL